MKNPSEIELGTSQSLSEQNSAVNTGISLEILKLFLATRRMPRWWDRIRLGKIGLFGASLYLFILAISLMKLGARGITPWLSELGFISNGANSLGFGWLFAYFIMSGSPVAAAALTFFDANLIDKISAFTMITGSRLGAKFYRPVSWFYICSARS